ncbi:histidine kinase [Asticcacaulis sp. AC460]|nr:histidine kinase [Asticcacaulis sp. AC460]
MIASRNFVIYVSPDMQEPWMTALERLGTFFNGPDDAGPGNGLGPLGREKDHLRLRTLVMLRWLAILGQTAMVLLIAFAFRYEIRLWLTLSIITASVWLNIILTVGRRFVQRMRGWEAALQLSFDAVQLALLLGVTGGLNNPFCLMLVAPATVAAANLPARHALIVVVVAMLATTGIAFWHLPLPWRPGETFLLPDIYRFGFLAAILLGTAFTAGYAWQAALESNRMEHALAATQAVLEREQRLSALGGLAAAAAHELGTPLGTIQVVAKEMLHSLKKADPLYEDAELLVSQSQRCRDILKQLSQKPETRDSVYDQMPVRAFLESIAAPYRKDRKEIIIEVLSEGRTVAPEREAGMMILRRPEWLHAWAAFVENAVDFAKSVVWVRFEVSHGFVALNIEDNGAGFSPDILSRLGDPYVSSRVFGEDAPQVEGRSYSGMGLGFFIAKTLCEHTGARVTFGNRDGGGAYVRALWRRDQMDILWTDEGGLS